MLQIGKTYLDTWGRKHEIMGHTRTGRHGQEDKDTVWSMSDHFFIESGKSTSCGYDLVVLSPAKEIEFFENRIKQIESVNSTDRLALVKDNLDNMRERINQLK